MIVSTCCSPYSICYDIFSESVDLSTSLEVVTVKNLKQSSEVAGVLTYYYILAAVAAVLLIFFTTALVIGIILRKRCATSKLSSLNNASLQNNYTHDDR